MNRLQNLQPILLSLLLLSLIGCSDAEKKSQDNPTEKFINENIQQSQIKYAGGFTVNYYDGYKIVNVAKPWPDASAGLEYVLVQKGKTLPENLPDAQIIEIPIDEIVVTSTTHIPLLDLLEESDKLTGFPNMDLISSPRVREFIDQGKVKELGMRGSLNLENVINLDPDLVMAFSMGPMNSQFKKLQQIGIPVVINADYLETNPLGRAEWIKFAALFFNKEKMADSIFNAIEANYLSMKNQVETVQNAPEVFTGVVYGDTWFMPGGRSWAALFFEDAGGDYLWAENESTGSLELSFEAVYNKAATADYWIGAAAYEGLQEIAAADERYTAFSAYKNGHIYTYNKRMGAKGGNEYLELGYMRPDIILADLIKIFHPGLLPEHELYFYKQLK